MRIAVTQMSNEALLRQLLDAMPSYVFLVDRDVSILDYNAAAGEFLGAGPQSILGQRGGNVFHCLHSRDVPAGCGHGPYCESCVIRRSVKEAFDGKKCVRRQVGMDLRSGRRTEHLELLITASPFQYLGHERVVLILEDLGRIAALQQAVPLPAKSHSLKAAPGSTRLRA
jgi:PAS domain-containing protein